MDEHTNISFLIADSEKKFTDGRRLFQEYAASLDIDLGFQNFADELATLEQQYTKPTGSLLLAYKNDIAIGCIAVRKIEDNTAELKRLYVQPAFRQFKIGAKLLESAIDIAKQLQYEYIRLDTIPGQQKAYTLYISMGFYKINPYRFNPVEGTIYMEKKLL